MPFLKKLKGGSNNASAPTAQSGTANDPLNESAPPTPDKRLPFANYRELYTMKNFWKTVKRNEKKCSCSLLAGFLLKNPTYQAMYPKIAKVDLDDPGENKAFEKLAAAYLQVFDDVVSSIESNPSDCSDALDRLNETGKLHKGKLGSLNANEVFQHMEQPFLKMVSDVLEDRYTDKAETLFEKFIKFCLKHVLEGYNS